MTFSAGAGVARITPPLGTHLWARERTHGADAVDDDLFAKALVLALDGTKVAIITADILAYTSEFAAQVEALVEERTGIAPGSLILSASHTHNGPSFEPPPPGVEADFSQAYIDSVADKMADAVLEADQARVEAKVGWGVGDGGALLFNRRPKTADGAVVMSFEPPAPEIARNLEFGPVDPEVGVVRIDTVTGEPIATLINFGAHNVCTKNNLYSISADYAGHAMATVEGETGGACLFSLGCAGNVVPIERGEVARGRIGRAVGQEAVRVWKEIDAGSPDQLLVSSTPLELPAPFRLPMYSPIG